MITRMFTVGMMFTNCFVVWCEKTNHAIVVDPGFNHQRDAARVLGILESEKLRTKFIVNTHGHPDHTCGNGIVKEATDAPILIHELDSGMLDVSRKKVPSLFGLKVISPAADELLKEGEVIRFGEVRLKVVHTPGHSQGSISLIGSDCVFTGDTLFAGSIGRVDLPGGSETEIMRSLREKLAVLPDKFTVYPGHGPTSTIGKEKHSNPFLQENFDISFLE